MLDRNNSLTLVGGVMTAKSTSVRQSHGVRCTTRMIQLSHTCGALQPFAGTCL